MFNIWAEVNLGNLVFNFKNIKKSLVPGTKVLAVVKQNAYGHGIVEISRKLQQIKADFLGVNNLNEALLLRKNGVKLPILVLSYVLPDYDFEEIARNNIRISIYDQHTLRIVKQKTKLLKHILTVHLNLDTGMGRLGFSFEEMLEVVRELFSYRYKIAVEGIFSHFSSADTNKKYTSRQIKKFKQMLSLLEENKLFIPLKHISNSAGIINKQSHFNMVRVGLSLYGIKPSKQFDIKLKPVMSFKARLISVKKVPKNTPVSYGATFITQKPTILGVLSCGYAYGYPWRLSNKGYVLIRGQRARILGRVCMDHIIVDLSRVKEAKIGDEAVLLGRQAKQQISAELLAKKSGTIPYEIISRISYNIPRIYYGTAV